ncbi:fungal-specific transcription factor domain-containing protein [Rhexocercosporidium sp. MPI-PUGE-AT-0058]|nr:fungal-specific transcription factor domain-containing protein [Rhexocercosporidium sp. MPI-PUGE-AT-0058]
MSADEVNDSRGGDQVNGSTKLGDLLLPKALTRTSVYAVRELEKHFSLIHDSLREIKDRLGKLEVSPVTSAASPGLCLVDTGIGSPFVPETAFQSETSFDSHSVQASATAEYSAAEVAHNDVDQEIHASLNALKSLLRGQGTPSPSNNLSFPRAVAELSTPKVELPPMPVIIEVLSKASGRIPLVILHSGLRDDSLLEELCKKIYFPTKHVSKGEITLMNGLLFYVFGEYCMEDGPASSLYPTYAKLCEKNFVAGLQHYDCLVTPTLENIQSLLLGALKAQEDSRPALCWTFVSTGARLCQILGYHREAVISRDPTKLAEAKRHVFWMLYMIDKTLSLNLGHTSNFPSHDIDVEMYSPSENPLVAPWNRVMIAFAEFSKLQARLYDELYSVRARREKSEVRSRTIEELVACFYTWHAKFKQINTAGAQCGSDLDIIIGSSDFIFYSVLTILYGAQTSPAAAIRISSQRYEVARLSLECHVQNWTKLSPNDISKCGIYSDWLIDYASFAPFLVVFTHAIAAHSPSDVSLLSQTLTTLESMRSRSETHTKLCQKCRVFLRFAKAFVSSQQPPSGFQNEEDGSFVFSTTGDPGGYFGDACADLSFPTSYGLGAGNGDLESMSAFLGSCFGENSMMGGIWNTEFQGH